MLLQTWRTSFSWEPPPPEKVGVINRLKLKDNMFEQIIENTEYAIRRYEK